MTESDLKRYLVRSIRAQGGLGHRFEDKYTIGWPDLLLIPEHGPVFFAEVKLIKLIREPRLTCTPTQEIQVARLSRMPVHGRYHCHGVLIGFSLDKHALYIGQPGQLLKDCRFVPRPTRIDSSDWWITELLGKYNADAPKTKTLVEEPEED